MKIKAFFCVFLTVFILTNISIFAASNYKNIKVLLNSVSVFVNGKSISSNNIVYNGNVYIQADNLSKELNKNYTYDKTNNKVYITDKFTPNPTPTPTPKATTTPIPINNSRKNPASVGETLYITTFSMGGKFQANITMTEFIRGDEAWPPIYEANMFNDKPENGYEYILAKFRFNVIYAEDEEIQYYLSQFDFKVVSEDGKDYSIDSSCIAPEPEITAKLYVGASHEGYVGFLIKTTDLKPVIVFQKSTDGKSGIWFKGYY